MQKSLKTKKTIKFKDAISLLNEIKIPTSPNLVAEDKELSSLSRKSNGGLCIRLRHKLSPQDYSVRFLHPAHSSEDKIGKTAFWRKAIMDAFEEAGWID